MRNITDLFMKLVTIDSVSGEEQEMSKYVSDFLSNYCQLQPTIDAHNNVFVHTDGHGEPLFFNAHLDTVEPGSGIVPFLKDGIITSKGETILGADDKAAVAAILTALEHITQNPQDNWRPLDIVFTTSEEVGCYGAIGFDKTQIRAKTGFIFDGAGPVGDIMSASPYYARFDISILGTSAHAGYPQDAIPALPVMLKLVQKIEQLKTKDVLLNVGRIEGGTVRNAIIGSVTLNGEIRSFYSEQFLATINSLQTICDQNYACKIDTEIVIENPGYIFSDQDIAPVKKQIETILNKKISVKKSFGVSDANIFNENTSGLKVFNLGDGSSGAHTMNESTTVEALQTMQQIILKLSQNEGENHV